MNLSLILGAIFIGMIMLNKNAVPSKEVNRRRLEYRPFFNAAENKYRLPSGLLERVAQQESNFNPLAVSPVGALGLMQFMPATARELGIDPLDPLESIDGAGRYFRWLYDTVNDWSLALAAYNWGIGNVINKGMEAAPLETRKYVAEISRDLWG